MALWRGLGLADAAFARPRGRVLHRAHALCAASPLWGHAAPDHGRVHPTQKHRPRRSIAFAGDDHGVGGHGGHGQHRRRRRGPSLWAGRARCSGCGCRPFSAWPRSTPKSSLPCAIASGRRTGRFTAGRCTISALWAGALPRSRASLPCSERWPPLASATWCRPTPPRRRPRFPSRRSFPRSRERRCACSWGLYYLWRSRWR